MTKVAGEVGRKGAGAPVAVSCPICKTGSAHHYARARDIEYFTSDDDFDFFLCEPCGVLVIEPMLKDSLREIYPNNYYSFVGGRRSFVQSVKEYLDRRYFSRVLRNISGPRLSVLDIGGGHGWLLDTVKSADSRVTDTIVVDIDDSARDQAESRGHRFFKGTIQEFETDERFDLILMLNLIEHVPDPQQVLENSRRLLKHSGRLLIKTPNFDALDAWLFRHRSWAGYHTPRHFVIFKRGSIERLCRTAGLEVQDFSYTQGAPFWSVSVLDILRRANLCSVSAARPAVYHPLMPLLQATFALFDGLRSPFSKLSQMQLVLRLPN